MNAIWWDRKSDEDEQEAAPLSGGILADYVVLTGEEDGEEEARDAASDNDAFPLHELLQGCIWRDAESAQAKAGILDVDGYDLSASDADRWRELDFSEERRGARGFLDEEWLPFAAEYEEIE